MTNPSGHPTLTIIANNTNPSRHPTLTIIAVSNQVGILLTIIANNTNPSRHPNKENNNYNCFARQPIQEGRSVCTNFSSLCGELGNDRVLGKK